MTLIAIAVLIGLAVTAVIMFAIQVAPARPDTIRRLEELTAEQDALGDTLKRRRRQERSERLNAILEQIGGRMETAKSDYSGLRLKLIQAGFVGQGAVAIYLGARVVLGTGLAVLVFILLEILGLPTIGSMLGALWGLAVGFVVPSFIVGSRSKKRQHEIIKAMPDALDLLVVCVEAGLGLNQALVRVADEIGNVSPVLAEQLDLTNLEIRAGTPREDALRHLGDRTGAEDVRSFAQMLIQTDRFGTSIADALRVHADVLRTKRRQRAEEAAAKTAIKMLFPLVLFIFPAMFVVILGPAIIQVVRELGKI